MTENHGADSRRGSVCEGGFYADNPAVMLLLDPDSGAVVDANPAACEWYGWSREELLARNISEINTLPEDAVREEMAAARARKRGVFSFKHRRADGSVCDVEVFSVPVQMGDRVLLHSLVHDVRDRKLAERELLETTTLLSGLLDSIPDIVFFKDLEGHYLGCNAAHARFVGLDAADIVGRTDHDLFGAEVADGFRDRDALVLGTGEARQNETWMTRHDGARILVDTHKAPLRNACGEAIGVVGVGRDITKRRFVESQLSESEARLRDFAFSAAQWLWEVDENGVYTYTSQRSADGSGQWSGDVIGKTPFDFMPAEEAVRVRAFFEETAARKAPIVDFESWYVGADGERHYLLTNGVPLLDEAGNLKGYRGADRDITLRKRAEEALRQTTERLTLATHAGDVGVWEVDVASKAVTFDERMFALYGMEPMPQAEINAAWRARLHPEDRERVEAMLAVALQGDLDVDHDIRAVWPDGSVHIIRSVGELQRDASGRPVRMIGTSRDVTMYRETETELRRLRDEEMLHQREEAVRKAVVAERSRLARELHDSVTQALFAATLRGEALQRLAGSLAPDAEEALGDLVVLTRGALAEMRSLLLEMRPEALETVPLHDLLRQLVEAAESRAVIKVSLATDGHARPSEDVKLVFYRVAQEALNNVVRHSRAKRAWVDLGVSEGVLRLVVGDDGCGFDPLRSHAGRLGLEMMRERAAAIGAGLDIASKPTEGTVVTLQWPEGEEVREHD